MSYFADRFLSFLTVFVLLSACWTAAPAQAQRGDTAAVADDKATAVLIVPSIKPICRTPPGILKVPCQYKKLQKAINAAQNGDKILVAPGVYKGNNNTQLQVSFKSFTMECTGAPGSCVIDAEGNGRIMNLAFSGSLFRGFKFINGKTTPTSFPSFLGGAIYSNDSLAAFDQCIFENNEATGFNTGGGAYAGFGSSDVIVNSLLVGNKADFGSAINLSGGGSTVLRNSTVTGNIADDFAAISVGQIGTVLDIRNSIVWGNLPATDQVLAGIGVVDANYSIVPADVLPNLGGTGSLAQDPLFTNPALGDYRPDTNAFPASPAINNGDPNFVPFAGERDLDDSCRNWCTDVDMGAYEDPTCVLFDQYPATDTPLAIPDGNSAGVESDVVVSDFGNVTITGVYVSLSHPSLSQLRVYLVAPDGTEDQLCSGCNQQFYTITNDFLGKPINGTWTLRVVDPFTGSVGTLEDWRLDLEYAGPVCNL